MVKLLGQGTTYGHLPWAGCTIGEAVHGRTRGKNAMHWVADGSPERTFPQRNKWLVGLRQIGGFYWERILQAYQKHRAGTGQGTAGTP